jgi:hypothetical protein
MKITIMGRKLKQEDWDLVVDPVVHSINTRVLSIHSFSPAELLLGFNPNKTGWDVRPNTESAAAVLRSIVEAGSDPWDSSEALSNRQLERLTRLQHIREEAAIAVTEDADRKEETQRPTRHIPPCAGDLVLLRRFLLDQRHGNKLEPRWEGPYLLGDLAWHKKSGRLYDINTRELVKVKKGALKDRVHLNDLKLYLTRRTEEANLVDLVEYGEAWKPTGDVYDLEGLEACMDEGCHVHWEDEAQGVDKYNHTSLYHHLRGSTLYFYWA